MRLLCVCAGVVAAGAACLVDADFVGTSFLCSDGASCPEGQQCIDGECKSPASAACGDGVLDDGELCESPFDGCCDQRTCQPLASGNTCRQRVSECDLAELCDGTSAECPTDVGAPDQSPCVAGVCQGGRCSSANLLAHWPFDEAGGMATDVSGNGRTAEIFGARRVAGRLGSALEFFGNGDQVVDENGGTYLNGLAAVSLTMWVRSGETNSDRGLFTCDEPAGMGPDGIGLSLRYDIEGGAGGGGGSNGLKYGVSTTAIQTVESPSDLQTTEWQFLALTWTSGANAELFVDGVRVTPLFFDPAVSGTTASVARIIIGRGAKDIESSWRGLIDDVRIYNRALDAAEILALMSI